MSRTSRLVMGVGIGALASSGCGSLLGLDDFVEGTSGAGGGDPSSSATSSSTGSTTTDASSSTSTSSSTTSSSTGEGGATTGPGAGGAGQGGGGAGPTGSGGGGAGGGEPCPTEGATESCYSGPDGTVDVGICVAGSRRCEGGFWTACDGEIVPSAEDLATWADEGCFTDAAELVAFVRYDGTSDDYPVGVGNDGDASSLVAAVGIYGALTVGGQTYSTNTDSGTVFIRHQADGSVGGTNFLPAVGGSFWSGNGFSLFAGFMEPQTINSVAFPASFVALLDTGFVPLAALDADCTVLAGQHGLCGSGYKRLERFQASVANRTLTSSLVFDFGANAVPRSVARTSGAGTPYVVVGGSLNGAVGVSPCNANGTADPLIATFTAGNGTCTSMTVLESNGSASISSVETLGNTLFVSGTVNGSIRDENGNFLASEGSSSAFVARLTLTNGVPSLIWLRAFGATGGTFGGTLAPDDAGGTAWVVDAAAAVDFGAFSAGPGRVFVSVDAAGSVRYARPVGADAAVRRLGPAVLFAGFVRDDLPPPFELTDLPPPGSTEDAFLSIHALP